MAKNKYYTDDDYVEAQYVIYNDLDPIILSGLSQAMVELDKEFMDNVVEKGEKYVDLVEYGHDGYALTNYGRVINTHRKTQLQVNFSSKRAYVYIQSRAVELQQVFEDMAWEFDLQKVFQRHVKYNWKRREVSEFNNNEKL